MIRLLVIMISITMAGCDSAPIATVTAAPTPDFSGWNTVSYWTQEAPLYAANGYAIIVRDELMSYRHGSIQNRVLVKRGRDGEETIIAERLGSDVIFSPDGAWLAFAVQDESLRLTLYRVKVDGSELEALTDKSAFRFMGARDMIWTSDDWIQAEMWTGGQSDLDSSWPRYRIAADGSGTVEPILAP